MGWFNTDRKGMSKLFERRGKEWVAAELLQNAWDAPGTTEVSLTIEPVPGRALANVRVEDNSPEGFVDLAHAFTLFAPSVKKDTPTLRGRFSIGEKLVLALAEEATIATTKGTVHFAGEERQEFPRRKLAAGTVFTATIKMTREEVERALVMVRTFVCPEGIRTVVNGEALEPRFPIREFGAKLTTEIADAEGILRRPKRETQIQLFDPPPGIPARIYELGIPVTETGDRYDVNIMQKVPLSLERDSISTAYLRDVRSYVLNNSFDELDKDEAAKPWVADAIEAGKADPAAVRAVVQARFGEKVVSFDPSDRESNDRAAAAGYTVVHGGAFSGAQWEAIRNAQALRPAGQVTPTPKPFHPDGRPAVDVDRTPAMEAFAEFCIELARRTLGVEINVRFLDYFNAAAAYGSRGLDFNVSRLGKKWFEGPLKRQQLDLVLHELGHEYAPNHFSTKFNDALTRLGAEVTLLALTDPAVFDLDRYGPEAHYSAAARP